MLKQLDHPNIVRLEEVYESETEIYLVQELEVCSFLIFMKKIFHSWTTAVLFLSFFFP